MRQTVFSAAILYAVFFSAQFSFAEAGKIKAFVSILPQAYFVERVGGDLVDMEVLVGPGMSPATYEPTSRQMARLGEAQVYFRIGTPFEKGIINKLERLYENLRIVDTRQGIKLRYFKGHHHESAHHEEDRHESHHVDSIPDPHIWMDPKLVIIQAKTICDALSTIAPAQERFFNENLNAFTRDLEILDKKLASILAPLKGRKFYVFHPAFGYFGDSYGLIQTAVEIEGKSPSAKQLALLIEGARKDRVHVIFVQPQYARKGVEAIAKAIDGAVVPINPLPEDYLVEMESMAQSLNRWLDK
jgi:zinc transport system substrate-binding protein